MAIFFSEIRPTPGGGEKFLEIVTTDNEPVSGYSIAVYDSGGSLRQTLPFGNPDTTLGGRTGYVVGESDGLNGGFSNDWSVAIVDDTGTVIEFVGIRNPPMATDGPAAGMTATGIGQPGPNKSLSTSDGGATYSVTSPTPGTIPCYAPGTLIETPAGLRAVEALRPGDLVLTRDSGAQEIRWIRSSDHPLEEAAEDARPVLIHAGALGRGKPDRDLIVSPQHRILVGGLGQLDWLFANEIFVPAKALTGLPGIRHMLGRDRITWVHFAFSSHEVVRANGCWSESLLLGPMVVSALPAALRKELSDRLSVRPDGMAGSALNGPVARPCLSVDEARYCIEQAKLRDGGLEKA